MARQETIPTTPTDGIEEDPMLLYSPIAKQIDAKKVPWKITYEMVTPEQAQQWLDDADAYDKIGQRPRTKARIKRWRTLYETSRYAFFNPMAAICLNEDGILLNGGNRLAALAEFDQPVGFQIIRNCPTWLVNYFDNGNTRSLRESMFINRRDVRPHVQQTIRLGMRYEEFLFGKRGEYGWVEWARVRDENVDIDNFMDRREFLIDCADRGKGLTKLTNLQAGSGACFIAYQQLAWPEGIDKLEEFLDGLNYGSMLKKGHPALTLREWANRDGYIGGYTHGRREGHLLLLFKFFLLFMEQTHTIDVRVARGLPMSMPYHPDGWETGCKNAREALLDMD